MLEYSTTTVGQHKLVSFVRRPYFLRTVYFLHVTYFSTYGLLSLLLMAYFLSTTYGLLYVLYMAYLVPSQVSLPLACLLPMAYLYGGSAYFV